MTIDPPQLYYVVTMSDISVYVIINAKILTKYYGVLLYEFDDAVKYVEGTIAGNSAGYPEETLSKFARLL